MRPGNVLVTLLMSAVILFTWNCSNQPFSDAGSSVAGNARILGSLCYSNGTPAVNTHVAIIPVNYNPLEDSLLPASGTVSTDAKGGYSFEIDREGFYNIYAADSVNNKVLIKSILFTGHSIDIPSHALIPSGSIKIIHPVDKENIKGYVYIPGTPVYATMNKAGNQSLVIDGVPADSSTSVTIVADSIQRVTQNVAVSPGDTAVILNPLWQYSMNLFLNTSINGADISSNQIDFPVAVRLGLHNFNFNEAKPDGSDIRFSKKDGTQLPYEIAKWNPDNNFAEIWVKVDTIFSNNDSQYIVMYWGNPNAVSMSSSREVFDTAKGFQGVWHLSETMNDTVRDASANGFHGIPQFSITEKPRANLLGRFFNGTGCIVMPNTIRSKLSLVNNSDFTISAWVYSDLPVTTFSVVAGKGNEQYSFNLRFLTAVDSRWEFVSRADSTGQIQKPLTDNYQIRTGEWNYIAGVAKGAQRYLFVNGKLVQSWTDTLNTITMLPYAERNFSIGGLAANNADLLQNTCFFIGYIDEVRFSTVARSDEWIKLCYANQQQSKTLVQFGQR